MPGVICLFVLVFITSIPVLAEMSLYRFGYSLADVEKFGPIRPEDALYVSVFNSSIYEPSALFQSRLHAGIDHPGLFDDPTVYRFISTDFYCYPNPFSKRSGTVIGYSIPEDSDVTLKVYNLFGHLIFDETYPAGQDGGKGNPVYNRIVFNERVLPHKALPAGAYFAFLVVNGKVVGKTKLGVLP